MALNELRQKHPHLFHHNVVDGIAFDKGELVFIEIKSGTGQFDNNQLEFAYLCQKNDIRYKAYHIP